MAASMATLPALLANFAARNRQQHRRYDHTVIASRLLARGIGSSG